MRCSVVVRGWSALPAGNCHTPHHATCQCMVSWHTLLQVSMLETIKPSCYMHGVVLGCLLRAALH